MEESYSCSICNKSFAKKCYLRNHTAAVHSASFYECSYCGKTLKGKCSLKTHVLYMHTDVPQLECTICNYTTKHPNVLKDHIANHTSLAIYSCDKCDFTTKHKKSLKGHCDTFHNKTPTIYSCKEPGCAFKTKHRNYLPIHVRGVHSAQKKKHVCDDCDYSTHYKTSLRKHIDTVHTLKLTRHKCPECKETFKRKVYLERHLNAIHVNPTIYRCKEPECDFNSSHKSSVTKHYKRVHLGQEYIYKCEYCEKTYSYKSHLNRHTAKEHIKEDAIVCEECGYETHEKSHMKRHIQIMHNRSRTLYVCKEYRCKFTSNSRNAYEVHMREMHNKTPELLQCDKCTKTFTRRIYLTKHFKTVHMDLKDSKYACNPCSTKFRFRLGLDFHNAMVHGVNMQRFSCDVKGCTFVTKYTHYIPEHKAIAHELGDICDICVKPSSRLRSVAFKEGKKSICHICYFKIILKGTASEKRMSEYLDKNYGTDFLIASDTRIYGDVCQRYRPDKLYGDHKRVIQIECDEYQHSGTNSSYSCEEKRISNIYDEFSGKEFIVIRWNPHGFTHHTKKGRVMIDTRLALLLKLLNYIETITFESPITVIYMFYTQTNPHICKRLPKHYVYSESDFSLIR